MDLLYIVKICKEHTCETCQFSNRVKFRTPEGEYQTIECPFFKRPREWNVDEIERCYNVFL